MSSKSLEEAPSASPVRHMSLLSGASMITGYIIGSGIFAAPGEVFAIVNSSGAAILLFIFGGLLATTGAISYAELGVLFPKNGADHVYLTEAFHPIAGMGFSISNNLLATPSVEAALAAIFGAYTTSLIRYDSRLSLADQQKLSPDDWTPRLIGVCAIIFVACANILHKKAGTKIQNLFTAAKLAAMAVIIVVGFYYLGSGKRSDALDVPFGNASPVFMDYTNALTLGMFAYTGFNNLNAAAGELKNPSRNLPLAIIFSMALSTTLYALANLAYFAVLGSEEMKTSKAVAQALGVQSMGTIGAYLMSVGVMLSTFGAMNAAAFGHSRFLVAAADENVYLPKFISKFLPKRSVSITSSKAIELFDTPHYAFIMNAIIACLYLLFFKDFSIIGRIASFTQLGYYGLSSAAVIRLRYTRPDAERAFKVPMGIPIFFIICVIAIDTLALVRCDSVVLAVGYAAAVFLTFVAPALIYYFRVMRTNEQPQSPSSSKSTAPSVIENSAADEKKTEA